MPEATINQPSELKQPARKESIFASQVQHFEYRNADDELICRVQVKFSTAPEYLQSQSGELMGRRILNIILIGEKDGQETHFDLVEFLRAKGLDASIFQADQQISSEYYHPKYNQIVLSSLETPVDISTLLHEFGHADQKKNNIHQQLDHLSLPYRLFLRGILPEAEECSRALEAISTIFDMEPPPHLQKDLDQYIQINDAIISKRVDINLLSERLSEIKSSASSNPFEQIIDIGRTEEELLKARFELQQLHHEAKTLLHKWMPMLKLPIKIGERNATARAFTWMRAIKQTYGIDLFQPAQFEPIREAVRTSSDCMRMIIDLFNSFRHKPPKDLLEGVSRFIRTDKILSSHLRRALFFRRQKTTTAASSALATYGADTKHMRRNYGRIPVPKDIQEELTEEDII